MLKINQKAESIPFYLTKKVSEGVAAEPNVVNLSRGQAGFLPPQEIYDEAKRVIDRNDKTVFRYEKSAGSNDLRKSIANWYGRQYNLDVNPNNVTITVGGTGAISLTLYNFTNPGGQIIIPDPSYPFYMLSANHGLENREITRIHTGQGKVSRNSLEPLVKENMNLLVLTSPNNPTGVVYDEKTIKEILDLAKQKDFFVFYDENHFPEIYDDNKHLPIQLFDKDKKNSIMLGSLSRLAIQGDRIGWAVLPDYPDIAQKYIAQSPFASTRAQKLAGFVLDNYENLGFEKEFKEYEEKRNWFVPELNKFKGFKANMPEGTSYVFPDIRGFVEENRKNLEKKVIEESKKRNVSEKDISFTLKHNSMLIYRYLLYEAGVGCVPGIAYGPNSDNNIRFTFSIEKEHLSEAINRMNKILDKK